MTADFGTMSGWPKIIFFDAAGTLIHLPKGVGWHYREVAGRHGCDVPEKALKQAFYAAWQAAPEQPETRKARPDDDKGWWRTLVEGVLDACEPHTAGLDRDAYFEELYAEFTKPGIWELYPEVEETLSALEGKVKLGILSNFDGRLRSVLADLGVASAFQHWAISSEVGADKPSPWIFQHALALAGATPAEAIHVGDDPVCDWAAAEAAGLRAFKLERPQTTLAGLMAMLPS